MAKFNIDKKGYNIDEVDDYINKTYNKYESKLSEQKDRIAVLKNEVDSLNLRLSNYIDKDEQISKALIYAVEKSEQIEKNAKNIFNLEIKRVVALYSRWEDLLLEVEKQYSNTKTNAYLNSLMDDFKQSIEDISKNGLVFETKSIKDDLRKNSDQFIKNILNKMDYLVNNKPIEVASIKSNVIHEFKSIQTDLDQSAKSKIIHNEVAPKSYSSIKSINQRLQKLNLINTVNESISKGESFADKFLNSKDEIKLNAYAKNFAKRKTEKSGEPFDYAVFPEPNSSGFDLKETINPKENLDEIMKSFDFFDE